MNLVEFTARRLTGDNRFGQTFRALCFGLWVMLAKPPVFEVDGQQITNQVPNGAVRVAIGGLLMIATGVLMTVFGVLATLLLLTLLLLSPLLTLAVMASVAWRTRKLSRELEARIAAAREARRHGA